MRVKTPAVGEMLRDDRAYYVALVVPQDCTQQVAQELWYAYFRDEAGNAREILFEFDTWYAYSAAQRRSEARIPSPGSYWSPYGELKTQITVAVPKNRAVLSVINGA